jgi:hypothetical protein
MRTRQASATDIHTLAYRVASLTTAEHSAIRLNRTSINPRLKSLSTPNLTDGETLFSSATAPCLRCLPLHNPRPSRYFGRDAPEGHLYPTRSPARSVIDLASTVSEESR